MVLWIAGRNQPSMLLHRENSDLVPETGTVELEKELGLPKDGGAFKVDRRPGHRAEVVSGGSQAVSLAGESAVRPGETR